MTVPRCALRRALSQAVLTAVASALALSAVATGSAGAATHPTAGPALLAAAGWHGRAIREPKPSARLARSLRWPDGWSAGAVALGAGMHRPGGSARVREIQGTLRRLGYRPGPVDGRLGPRTASAIAWFQIKHELRRTGRVDAWTLELLRTRTRTRTGTPGQMPTVTLAADERRASQPAATADARDVRDAQVAAMNRMEASHVNLTIPLAMIAVAGLLSTALLSLPRRNQRRAVTPSGPAAPPPALTVVGYTTAAAPGADPRRLEQVDAFCRQRGWALTRIIEDEEPESGRLSDRPGLFKALDVLVSGRVGGLVVARLGDLTSCASDLVPLIRWIEDAHVRVVVLDVGIDTATEPGRAPLRALLEVGSWDRRQSEPPAPRSLSAVRATGRGPGRPSVHDDPELVAWIGRMRADGMSLQAIADTLNEKGVPTLRGGALWRPSSVQSAVGYKRPASDARVPALPRLERGAADG